VYFVGDTTRLFFYFFHTFNRHPTSKEWRWKVDEPEDIVKEAIEKHQDMINSMKGAEGVTPEKLKKGMTVKHCALSLIGEPITYPRINELMDSLHSRGISSFLVTNPQFPDALEKLKMITQLYVSIDAPTEDEWNKVTRPVFSDGWDRFLKCLDVIRNKGARSVYRLTLVKDWNMNELSGYQKLIERGKPSFIEIKGVTFCGFTTSNLTMDNVPYHTEVRKFSEAIENLLEDYEIACEHEHSHLVLLAHKKFKIKDEWHTWIDYPKFIELANSGKEFSEMDYIEKTPKWALYNSKEQGFDPDEKRFRKKEKQ
jgi:tRNA wybutosine-synthesizing protein 1